MDNPHPNLPPSHEAKGQDAASPSWLAQASASLQLGAGARGRRRYRYGFAMAVVLGAVALRVGLLHSLGTQVAYVTFFPAVMLAALYGGLAAGLLATCLSGCLALYFWVEPVGHFLGKAPASWLGLAIFLIGCTMIVGITEAMREAQARSHQAELQAKLLTERQQAQEKLQQSELEFRCLFENSMDAVFLTVSDGRIKAANPVACAMFGRSESELCSIGRSGIIDSEDQRVPPALEERQRAGRARVELNFVRKDGSKFPAEVSSVIIGPEKTNCFVIIQDITERKRADQALQRLAKEWQTTFDSVQSAIWLMDVNRTPLRWNKAAAQLLKLGADGITIGTCCRCLHGPSIPSPNCLLTAMVQKRCRQTEVTAMEGSWMEIIADPIFNESGVIIGAVHVASDITERKQAQDALLDSEERYHRLFEAKPDALLLVDWKSGQLIDANAAALKLYDYTRQEFLSLNVTDLSTEPDLTRQAIAASATKVPLRWHQKKDGTVFPVEIAGDYLDCRGRKTHVAVIRDITKRRQAEEKLKESELRLRLAADAAGFGNYTYDFATNAGYFSPELRAILGAAPDRPLPVDADNVFVGIHPDDRLRFLEAMTAANNPCVGGSLRHDYRVIHPNGEVHWVQVRGQTTFVGEGDERRPGRAAGVLLDITERKRTEEELLASRAQLRALAGRLQSVREEERTHIAREIHDVLAQELTRLKIDLVWLHRRLTKPVETIEPGLLANRVAEMRQLTDEAIGCVQGIATELRPVVLDSLGLSAAVEWQLREFQTRAEIHCQANVPETEPPLDQDSATALFRILQESLTNVLRHAKATMVEVDLLQEGNKVILRVQDNGCGIPVETLNNPMSIGLAGMRERARLLHGQFEISSWPGSTILEVTLPILENPGQPKETV